MRPVQIWVPDTRRENFAIECKRQSLLLKNDPLELDSQNWLQSVADHQGWQ
ncbi:MAG: antitoxin MazE family protein [Rhodoferax sp.]|nr:antitoxin MazE family protein [Rhodoferax sp.]